MGVWFAFTAHYIVKEPLCKVVDDLIGGKETRLVRMFSISTALFLIALVGQIINFEINMGFENPAEWSTMMVEKCGAGAINDAYQTRSLADFGEICMVLGAFYGLLLT